MRVPIAHELASEVDGEAAGLRMRSLIERLESLHLDPEDHRLTDDGLLSGLAVLHLDLRKGPRRLTVGRIVPQEQQTPVRNDDGCGARCKVRHVWSSRPTRTIRPRWLTRRTGSATMQHRARVRAGASSYFLLKK
jgi:hypothetical protein